MNLLVSEGPIILFHFIKQLNWFLNIFLKQNKILRLKTNMIFFVYHFSLNRFNSFTIFGTIK